MTDKIINFLDRRSFKKIFEYIIQDKRLNNREKLILIILFNKADDKIPDKELIGQLASLPVEKVKKAFYNLIEYDWCREEILEPDSKKTASYLRLPFQDDQTNSSLYNQPGSKIARNCSEIFGTRQLTPTDLNKLTSFISDGIEEDVIIEIMKLSADKAEGNPVNYAVKILNHYLKCGIHSWEDFKKERSEREEYERQVQGDNRAEEKRKELHEIEELEKRGWNE